ncbi:MAG: PAS domain-containing protein, partial [Deltaproteobacteria bacterium]
KKIGVYCLKSAAIVLGALLLGSLTDLGYPVQIHEPPLINPIRGYALAILVFGGSEFFFPVWLSSSLLNKILLDAPIFLSVYRACIESLAALVGSRLCFQLFNGRVPVLKSKDWLKFSLWVIPSILCVGHLVDWGFDMMQAGANVQWARLDWQWLPAKALGYLLTFPFFAGVFSLRRDSFQPRTLFKDTTIWLISVVFLMIVFYVDLSPWHLDKFSHTYLAILILLGVGFFARPLGLSFFILILAYLMLWNRLGFLGHRSILVEASTAQFQAYLFFVGFFVPWFSSLFREKTEDEGLKKSYRIVERALNETQEESPLKRLGVYSENIAIGLFDLQYRCLELNQAMADIYGMSIAEAIGKSVFERLGKNSKVVSPIFEEVVKSKKPIWNSKVVFESQSAFKTTPIHLSVSYIPVFRSDGAVAAVIAAVTPVDPDTVSEEKQWSRTNALTFSHDLQAPLRNVVQSLKILNEKLKGESDFERRHFVQSALDSASKMKIML